MIRVNIHKIDLMTSFTKSYATALTAHAGFKSSNTEQTDLCLLQFPEHSQTALVTTQNQFVAAPVVIARKHIEASSHIRALLINSGNANCGTGKSGTNLAYSSCIQVAQQLSYATTQILPFSTGTINKPILGKTMVEGINELFTQKPRLIHSKEDLLRPAKAIMTTDTQAKFASHICKLNDEIIHIWGIAKGSGMIHPNMATMLAFLWTDATLPLKVLQQSLLKATDKSFNRITVDGDTSTNDCCTLTSLGNGVKLSINDVLEQQWQYALNEITQNLAHQIIKDGEGATKFVAVSVSGGKSIADCQQVANTVALSPLVKTAIYAEHPNLGRIAAAVGRSGVAMDFSQVEISLNDYLIMQNTQLIPGYDKKNAEKIMQQDSFTIKINLNQGTHQLTVWTSDLSNEYININADYRKHSN